MSRWTPCKRRVFVQRLRRLGFVGPFSGTRHQFMVLGQRRLAIPSNDEYSVPQLKMLLDEVEKLVQRRLAPEEWSQL